MKARWLLFVMLAGCAGLSRDCQSGCASSFGSDWLILQYSAEGKPLNCWRLSDRPVSNESGTDGIYWTSNEGHLVHISGWYNRVQVTSGAYETAAKQIGIELAGCTEGAYRP